MVKQLAKDIGAVKGMAIKTIWGWFEISEGLH